MKVPGFILALIMGPAHRPPQNNGAISSCSDAAVLFLTGEDSVSGAPVKTFNMSIYLSSNRALMLQKNSKRQCGSAPWCRAVLYGMATP